MSKFQQFVELLDGNLNDLSLRTIFEAANGDVDTAVSLFFESRDSNSQPKRQRNEDHLHQPAFNRVVQLDDPAPAPVADFTQRMFSSEEQAERVRPRVNRGPTMMSSQSSNAFSHLFRLPTDLMTSGSIERCAQRAQSQCRWLLVYIYDPNEFTSLTVNRDVWPQEGVRALVSSKYVLTAVDCVSEQAAMLSRWYHISHTPCVLVLNPLSGFCPVKWQDGVPCASHVLPPLIQNEFMQRLGRFSRAEGAIMSQHAAIQQQRTLADSLVQTLRFASEIHVPAWVDASRTNTVINDLTDSQPHTNSRPQPQPTQVRQNQVRMGDGEPGSSVISAIVLSDTDDEGWGAE